MINRERSEIDNSKDDKYKQYLQYLEESDSYMDGRGVLGNPYDHNSGNQNGYNDDHLWTDMAEDDCKIVSYHTPEEHCEPKWKRTPIGVYINLLQNPESYTGYTGRDANRVWAAIADENTFRGTKLPSHSNKKAKKKSGSGTNKDSSANANGNGNGGRGGNGVNTSVSTSDQEDSIESQQFQRLLSGLHSSISTHIAMRYFFEDKQEWGINIPFFVRAVGSHRDRVNNLYFLFLFVMRAVVKAKDFLVHYPYDTGHKEQDDNLKHLMSRLVTTPLIERGEGDLHLVYAAAGGGNGNNSHIYGEAGVGGVCSHTDIAETQHGFNESELFSIPANMTGKALKRKMHENEQVSAARLFSLLLLL